MIEVRNLVKKYGNHLAVDHLSFSVEEGLIYGFLGPNGAGKSTTMNIITGCLAATAGEVLIDGNDIYKKPKDAKKCIGYLPEQPPLYPDMTPPEYLNFVAELKGVPKKERKEEIQSVMDKTGLTVVQNRLIKNLSKGYKQRVGLAQAILGNPKVIILDEPTVGLDPAQIIEIRNLIKSLALEHTVIFSSHILSEVSEICDRIMIIAGGKLIAEDTAENLQSQFVSDTVLKINIMGSAENVENVLMATDGVNSYTITDEENGKVYVEVSCDKVEGLAETIAVALSAQQCIILGLEEEKTTLEDVFMELVTQDAYMREVMNSVADDSDDESTEIVDEDDEEEDDEDAGDL